MGIVVEEADEVVFWLGLIRDGELMRGPVLDQIAREANEILAIFACSQRTLRNRSNDRIKKS
jgi:hypothetical protein